jgi:TonB-linked SusC/RagA family outer membrane protein
MIQTNYIFRIAISLIFSLGALFVEAQEATGGNKGSAHEQGSKVVSGTIVDAATGKGASGARVSVTGFSAAICDEQGKFTLKVPDYNALIKVEGEGFQTRNIHLKGRTSIKVELNDESHESMYEQVVTPVGKSLRSDVSSSVSASQVTNSWNNPAEIPDAFLQGRVAGLNAVRRSGTPGVGANLFLRGFNSLYATNKPLLIIDDMVYDYNDYGESIIANNYTNPLSLIDIKDIQNVTVLKDASSIYGTKGANGAIIVTTTRAKQQATRIDFGAYYGANFAPNSLPVMNAEEYRLYMSDVMQARGLSNTEINALPYMDDSKTNPLYYATHNNTDWQSKIYNQSFTSNYYINVTGGDNIATYALSMGYLKNEGVVKNTDLSRYNTRFNAELNFSQRFTGSANLAFTYNEQNLMDQGIAPATNPIYLSLIKSPLFAEREINAEGAVSPNLADADMFNVSNPSAVVDKMRANNQYYRFFGSFGFKYRFNKGFSASTLIGITYDKVRENVFVPRKGVSNDTVFNAVIDSRMATQVKRLYTIFNDTRGSYTKNFGSSSLNANLGVRYQHNRADQIFALGFNSATDELISVQNGVNALRQVGGGVGEWAWLNFYGNVDYQIKNKYFFGFNIAADGSSRFGSQTEEGAQIFGNPFAINPSLSAAWLVSGENFMANSGISFLKVRATVAKTGNDDIGNYSARQTYRSQNLLGMQGLLRSGIANPALQWENVTRMNAGVDVGIFNDRVQFSADLWKNNTTQMLVYTPIESIFGFNEVLTNDGGMQTTGIDLNLNVRIINKTNLKWDLGFNASTFKNEITKVPNDRFLTQFAGATILTAKGQTAAQFYGLTTNGIFSTDAEALASGLKRKMADGSLVPFGGGDVSFTDRNGDGIIDDNDRTVLGSSVPSWFGGFNNRIAWKRFTLEVLFTFSAGLEVYNQLRHQLESASGTNNQLKSVVNRWRIDGQTTNTPRATWGDPMGNAAFSDRWIEDGSYLRMRTLSLQYDLPLKNQKFFKNMSFYATGNNLLTFTSYLGYDPEFSANPSVFAQGIDTGLEPVFRSVLFGVRMGL